MNRFGSHPNYKTMVNLNDTRLRASRGTAGREFLLNIYLPIRREGAPSGAAVIIVNNGYSGNI
jgi:hypothetical protein